MLIGWVAGVALAYETDQLTGRERQLADATPAANALMDRLLDQAIRDANARSGCRGADAELRMTLAEAIHRATSRSVGVWERGTFRAPGFSVFSASLERAREVERFEFPGRSDIYGGLTAWNSVILSTAGPCSTFEVAGVRIGSDKFDHFLDVGFHYLRAAERGGDAAAIAHGTKTERSFFGLLTSKTFSFADMRANWDGLTFYQGLFEEGSVVGRGADGCAVRRAPFDWSVWVNAEWDEVLNPPVYTHLVEQGVLRTLEARRAEVCASRARWDAGGWREAWLAALPRPAYVDARAPARRDPWQLAALCDPARTAPLAPSSVRPRDELRAARARSAGPGG